MQDFTFYLALGWDHIISWDAFDHLLFIAALVAIYLFRDWKKVLILVTAFTIGHSLTLALSVLDVVRFPDRWVEFLIPCTIVVTAISNLFQQNTTNKARWWQYSFALIFGLIHGMGFANTIRFILAEDQNLGISLLAFNVGLEFGQIVVVLVILLMAQCILQIVKVNRREWIIFLSAAVFSIALQMAIQRFP